MLFQSSFFWFLLLLYLIPIFLTGLLIFRKILLVDRLELLVPAGTIFGITLFVFLINLTSFFVKGNIGINLSYFFLILILIIVYFKKINQPKIKLIMNKTFILSFLSALLWGLLIVWKANFALIGSDTNLYYSVAHTFIKGNAPVVSPWQPDLPLVYHLGAFELLGAFYSFTNLSFEFLHILFSVIFIFCSSQIIIWIWKKHDSFISFLWGNLTAAIVLISFGFLKIAIPISIRLPEVSNLRQFFLWARNLPTVNQSIEAYGAPVNLDTLIYFIFHSFGLAIILSLIVLIIYSKASIIFYKWTIFVIGLTTLALINESIFVISFLALVTGGVLKEFQNENFLKNKRLKTNSIFIAMMLVIMCGYIVVQGGTITNLILRQKNLEKSILIFPSDSDIKGDLISYHRTQTISRSLPVKEKWLPLGWFHIGCDILILLCVCSFIYIKFSKDQKIMLFALFIVGISSLLAYYYVVPRYLAANGNRFLVFAFISFSLFLIYSLQNLFDSLPRSFLKYFLLGSLAIFILMPTILPPLALLTKTRFGENKLIPRKEQVTIGVEWIKNNLPYNSRVAVLDVRVPHPSGMARVMVQAGVFAPVFSSKVRVYTIEASPEYFDMAYFLNPDALRELNISFLLIDSDFFKSLPDLRKTQLENEAFFKKIFDAGDSSNWEKIYAVLDKYLIEGSEIGGSFKEFKEIITGGKIYIDNEENFNPSYLRRAIIFSAREKDLYYLSESGVYLNAEVYINQKLPLANGNYDYLVLGKGRKPKDICNCRANLIWKGLKDEVYVWKRID